MRIAVTGSSKLAGAIAHHLKADSIRLEDQVNKDDYDVFINNAHVEFKQCECLKEWFDQWRYDESKLIINISSRAGLSNLSKGYMYGAQKAALDHLAENLTFNSDKKCRITTLSLGMLEDELPSVKYTEVVDMLKYIIYLPPHLEINKILLQHSFNYQEVQQLKAKRY